MSEADKIAVEIQTPDAALPQRGVAALNELANRKGAANPVAFARKWMQRREDALRSMKDDPLRNGFEPDCWLVLRALMGCAIVPAASERRIKRVTGLDWTAWRDNLLRNVGLERPVRELVVLGANRAGKTDFAAKVACEIAWSGPGKVMIASQKMEKSCEVQMPRFWSYTPVERRRNIQTSTAYISYKPKTGYSGCSLITDTACRVAFKFYTQEAKSVFEGSAENFIWMDEEYPEEWERTARFRITSCGGKMLLTFTPISGYTPAVAAIMEGAQVIRHEIGWLLPRDGGEPRPDLALGLSADEVSRLRSAYADEASGGSPFVEFPHSRPYDMISCGTPGGWNEDAAEKIQRMTPGRAFELVPRLALARGGSVAIFWMHCRDNPYGRPLNLVDTSLAKGASAREETRCRVYGIARKIGGRRFSAWDRKIHVGGWSLLRETGPVVRCYREWPGSYDIPGIGVPEPWAIVSSRNGGRNDGERGGAQEKWSFGFLRYKFEFARLEGWNDYEDWRARCPDDELPTDDEIEQWTDANGSRESVDVRIVDGRAAQSSKISMREDKTLLDCLNELGMIWQPAAGTRISDGADRVVNALDVSGGKPRLVVAPECRNVIFGMENWTGADGQKGACKEPIDCLRYLYTSGCADGVMDRPVGRVCVLDTAPERNWFALWFEIRAFGADTPEDGNMACGSYGIEKGRPFANARKSSPCRIRFSRR